VTTFPYRIGAEVHPERLIEKTKKWSRRRSQFLVLRHRMAELA
jgi:hypothetical protein